MMPLLSANRPDKDPSCTQHVCGEEGEVSFRIRVAWPWLSFRCLKRSADSFTFNLCIIIIVECAAISNLHTKYFDSSISDMSRSRKSMHLKRLLIKEKENYVTPNKKVKSNCSTDHPKTEIFASPPGLANIHNLSTFEQLGDGITDESPNEHHLESIVPAEGVYYSEHSNDVENSNINECSAYASTLIEEDNLLHNLQIWALNEKGTNFY
ncbi:hypothetical protein PPYR_00752 [Photinus pyralis]|uniref:Uncharacterized protein n=1 Tax=Photinus pyralis TaxID=7054 RepID=A0A5N4B2F2_PHOPY|nr:hypothetical protein PPYR_00752 [Photinus pyralis]